MAVKELNMDKMLNAEANSDTRKKQTIDYKAEITKMLAHMDVVSERIRRNQLETEQLQAETRAILAEMKAV